MIKSHIPEKLKKTFSASFSHKIFHNTQKTVIMDLYESLKQNDKNKTMCLYSVMLEESSIDEHELYEYINSSWSYVSLHCPLSVLAIKSLSDHYHMDWKKMFSLQFYDQLYHDEKIMMTERKRRQRRTKTSSYAGHCVAFGCKVEGDVLNGQTWDTMDFYPDTDVFVYQHAKVVSHHGVFGSSYISKFGYSVTWTSTKTKDCQMNAIPSPIFLFEAMNNQNIKSIEDFIGFESKFIHSCSHCFSISDGTKISYLERTDKNVNTTHDITLPFAHCNTFLNSCYINSVKDRYSLTRIKALLEVLQDKKMTTEKVNNILTNQKKVWVSDEDWRTISAYVYNPKKYEIKYFDRDKVMSIK